MLGFLRKKETCQYYEFLHWSQSIAREITRFNAGAFNFLQKDRCRVFKKLKSKLGNVKVENFYITQRYGRGTPYLDYRIYENKDGSYTTRLKIPDILTASKHVLVFFNDYEVNYYKFHEDPNKVISKLIQIYLDNLSPATKNYVARTHTGDVIAITKYMLGPVWTEYLLSIAVSNGYASSFSERCECYLHSSVDEYYCSFVPYECR